MDISTFGRVKYKCWKIGDVEESFISICVEYGRYHKLENVDDFNDFLDVVDIKEVKEFFLEHYYNGDYHDDNITIDDIEYIEI